MPMAYPWHGWRNAPRHTDRHAHLEDTTTISSKTFSYNTGASRKTGDAQSITGCVDAARVQVVHLSSCLTAPSLPVLQAWVAREGVVARQLQPGFNYHIGTCAEGHVESNSREDGFYIQKLVLH